MPKKILPRIVAVSAGKRPHTLRIRWEHGGENNIDVSALLEKFRAYAPLRQDTALFRRVRVGEHGTDIVWSDELDMSADTLWRLAREQSGVTMSAEDFRQWRQQKALTLDAAASALGISRRMAAYYDHGDKPIPRVVALATQALT
jgi:AraC-like DNA-binding protein